MRGEIDVVPQMPWPDFLDGFRWRQGEHVSLIGPTGAGKTTLGLEILTRREYVVVVGTKPKDSTLDKLRGRGFKVRRTWPEHVATDVTPKLILWPRFTRPGDARNQQRTVAQGLSGIFAQGGWTVFIDEAFYVGKTLKLSPLLEMLWSQGRSVGISLVAGTQRPAHVPLMMYDQATHLFLWRDNDEANLKRIAGLGGEVDAALIRDAVTHLPKHSTLYVNTRTGDVVETRVDLD